MVARVTKRHDDSGVELCELACERRLYRGNNSECWVIDGTSIEGQKVLGVGNFMLVHTDHGSFIAQGLVARQHVVLWSDDELARFLESTLDRLGIGLDSGGSLEFMTGKHYIDLCYGG